MLHTKNQNKCVIKNSKTMNWLYLMTCEWDHQQEDELLPRSCSPQLAYLSAAHTNPQGGTAVFPGQSYSHKYFRQAGLDFSVFTRKVAEGLPRNLWMWRQQISFLQDRFKKVQIWHKVSFHWDTVSEGRSSHTESSVPRGSRWHSHPHEEENHQLLKQHLGSHRPMLCFLAVKFEEVGCHPGLYLM